MKVFTKEDIYPFNDFDYKAKGDELLRREAGFKKERKCNNSKRPKPRKRKR